MLYAEFRRKYLKELGVYLRVFTCFESDIIFVDRFDIKSIDISDIKFEVLTKFEDFVNISSFDVKDIMFNSSLISNHLFDIASVDIKDLSGVFEMRSDSSMYIPVIDVKGIDIRENMVVEFNMNVGRVDIVYEPLFVSENKSSGILGATQVELVNSLRTNENVNLTSSFILWSAEQIELKGVQGGIEFSHFVSLNKLTPYDMAFVEGFEFSDYFNFTTLEYQSFMIDEKVEIKDYFGPLVLDNASAMIVEDIRAIGNISIYTVNIRDRLMNNEEFFGYDMGMFMDIESRFFLEIQE